MGTAAGLRDLLAVIEAADPPPAVMPPKVSSPDELRLAAAALSQAARPEWHEASGRICGAELAAAACSCTRSWRPRWAWRALRPSWARHPHRSSYCSAPWTWPPSLDAPRTMRRARTWARKLRALRARRHPSRGRASSWRGLLLQLRARAEACLLDFGLRLGDDDALRACERARRMGFDGKAAIHPAQLRVIHDVFSPSAREREAAPRIVAAAARSAGNAVQLDDGTVVETPVVKRAQALLARAAHNSHA